MVNVMQAERPAIPPQCHLALTPLVPIRYPISEAPHTGPITETAEEEAKSASGGRKRWWITPTTTHSPIKAEPKAGKPTQ